MQRTIMQLTDRSKPANTDNYLCDVSFKEHSATSKKPKPSWWIGGKKPVNVCIDIPKLQITCEPEAIGKALSEHFQELQRQRFREFVENYIRENRANPIGVQFDDEVLAPEAIATWYTETSNGGRLTGEAIEAWFQEATTSIGTYLSEQYLAAGKSEQEISTVLLPKSLVGLSAAFKMFATPGYRQDAKQAAKFLKVVLAAEENDVQQKLVRKLNAWIADANELDLSMIA